MARASPGGVTTGCARCVPPSRRRCRSRSPRRRGRRQRAARHTVAHQESTRSTPAAKAAAWSAPAGLRLPQQSRGTWSSWSRNRRHAARVWISPARRSRFRPLTPPSRSRKNHSPSSRATQPSRPPPKRAVPSAASGLHAPQRPAETPFSPRDLSSCHCSLSVPGADSAPTNTEESALAGSEQMPRALWTQQEQTHRRALPQSAIAEVARRPKSRQAWCLRATSDSACVARPHH
jgi:hypothetical protein